ncbi:MAG: hypothetical protein NT033_05535 [Candidatus Omnitrophica bacterium]|nr:hypothetical protein [Candidatus Omnitrophota bacterium]
MQFGCLLPFLIIFNLFFGWMFLRPLYWAVLELGLILAFILTWKVIIKRITGFSRRQKHQEVIDVQGREIKSED